MVGKRYLYGQLGQLWVCFWMDKKTCWTQSVFLSLEKGSNRVCFWSWMLMGHYLLLNLRWCQDTGGAGILTNYIIHRRSTEEVLEKYTGTFYTLDKSTSFQHQHPPHPRARYPFFFCTATHMINTTTPLVLHSNMHGRPQNTLPPKMQGPHFLTW